MILEETTLKTFSECSHLQSVHSNISANLEILLEIIFLKFLSGLTIALF